MSLNGKCAVVTEGIGCLGLHIAKELISNGVQKIAIIGESEENIESVLSKEIPEGNFLFIKTNLAVKTEVDDAYNQIYSKFNQIDIVVNAATIFNDKDISKTIQSNVIGVMNSTVSAMNYMSTLSGGNGGHIIQISSLAGLRTIPVAPIYSSSKISVIQFTKCLGNDLYFNKTGIKFMTVCPGPTRIPLMNLSEKNILFSFVTEEIKSALSEYDCLQEPSVVGKCVISVIEKAKNGATVLVNNGVSKVVIFQEHQFVDL